MTRTMADTDMFTFAGAHSGMPSNKVIRTKSPATKKGSDIALKNTIIKSNSMKSKLHRGGFLRRDKSQKEEKYQINRGYAYIQRSLREDNQDRFLLTA